MKRPEDEQEKSDSSDTKSGMIRSFDAVELSESVPVSVLDRRIRDPECSGLQIQDAAERREKEEKERAVLNVRFIAQHMENLDSYSEVGKKSCAYCFLALNVVS